MTLKNEDAIWLVGRENVNNHLQSCMVELISYSNLNFPLHLNELFFACIYDQDNADLCCIPSAEDIYNIVKQFHPLKAPGSDGFPSLFFQYYCNTIGDHMIFLVQYFFQFYSYLEEINQTFIVFIPSLLMLT